MALEDLLTVKNKNSKKVEINREKLLENLDEYRRTIAYWRMYPDMLIDYYCSLDPNNTFKFYWYQRLMLRAIFRHKYTYMVFCRAYSKSFIGVMSLMLKAILYPGIKLFTVSEGKAQSAEIVGDKLREICKLIPALNKEIVWDTRGTSATTRQTKDSVVFEFKNGSKIENIAASEKTRGKRFQSGLMEEAATLDQEMLQNVVIPTLNVSRNVCGKVDEKEIVNQSQCYVTSAGFKSTFAYDKFIQLMCMGVARPKEAFVLGGDYRIPVRFGAISKTFVKDLKNEGTFNEATFDREYGSRWGGDVAGAFFDSSIFDKHRVLNLAEYNFNGRTNSKGYYVLGVDVGRHNCTTEICVIKVTPVANGNPLKQLVNIYTYEAEHFGLQAINIKRLFNRYNCKIAVVDGNGIGAGLIDFLVMDQMDPDTDELLCNWGVYNDDERRYKNFETPNTIHNALYIMKANAPLNTEMYSYCQSQLRNGRIKFLIDDSLAKSKLMSQTQGQKMSQSKRADYLKPYVQTNILREQMANLIEESEGVNIILKPCNRNIKHDKFSALIYGLYYCKLQEDKGKKRTRSINDFMFFTKH